MDSGTATAYNSPLEYWSRWIDMVVFRPFRGWKYNPDVVGDLNKVVCPPYDLITPELQESLLKRSPYNVVHLAVSYTHLRAHET